MTQETLDLSALHKAIVSLEDGLTVYSNVTWLNEQTDEVQSTLLAGVIQNFEISYEISVKMIRRRIELDAASPTEVDFNNFRDLLRQAAEVGLIADVEAWFGYREMRNITSYTYDHEKAEQVYQGSMGFIVDAKNLLVCLEKHNG
ncbi:MAG: nucleotidyltransferase substrate binding protein [Acidimicrobiales bacterium]